MTGTDIVTKTKKLNLKDGSYIVFGSCPMAVAGIRESQDIDMLVDRDTFEILKQAGWQPFPKSPSDIPLVKDDFEAHANWNFSTYKPTLKHLLSSATFIDGIPFASLQEVRKWKLSSGRPKDKVDIKLIDNYLASI